MRTIDVKGKVADGKLTVEVPPDLAPGEHNVKLVIEDTGGDPRRDKAVEFLVIHVDSWPTGYTFSREELYEDADR